MDKININLSDTKDGQKYFYIYNVVGLEKDMTHSRNLNFFLNADSANEYSEFAQKHYSEMYYLIYIEREIVWAK